MLVLFLREHASEGRATAEMVGGEQEGGRARVQTLFGTEDEIEIWDC
jgi:hypothetical protein